jgi:uncharacterized delta-60 repeat protein
MNANKTLIVALAWACNLLLSCSEVGAWQRNINSGSANAVAVDATGNVIAVGSTENGGFTVVKFNGVTGAELWRQVIGNGWVNAVSVDAVGDVVAAGSTNGVCEGFDCEYGYRPSDFTVIKFEGATGVELWRREFRGTHDGWDHSANAVALDAAGNVIAAGSTYNIGSGLDMTVIKMEGASGQQLWRREVNGSANNWDWANAVAVDAAGNVMVAGATLNGNSGYSDFTVVKFDGATGAEHWRKDIDGGGYDYANAIAVDGIGNVVAAGATSFVTNAVGDESFTVIKFDGVNGAELWRKVVVQSEGTGWSSGWANSVAVDFANNVVAAGHSHTSNIGTFSDLAVVKFDGASGAELWRNMIHSGANDVSNAVAVDATGNVVSAGYTQNPNTGIDFTVVKFDGASGQELWRQVIDGSGADSYDFYDSANAVAVDSLGNVVAAGTIHNTGTGNDFTVVKLPGTPLSFSALTANMSSPQTPGVSVTFTASAIGGIAPLHYKWWVFNGVTWTVTKDWSASSSFTWTAGVGGNYRIGVWVKSSGNPVDYPEGNAYTSIPFDINAPPALMITGLSVDQASPQPAGLTITFTATSSGGLAPHQYKWWVFSGGVWSVAKDWSASNTFDWTAGLGGNYLVGVWVKSSGNPVDYPEGNANASVAFTVNSPPSLILTGISADHVSPQPMGSAINFTATTTGGLAPLQYKWWVYNGVTWSVVRDWSTSNTFSWAPGIAGNYLVGVWVKGNLNPADAPEGGAYSSIAFTVSAPAGPCPQC